MSPRVGNLKFSHAFWHDRKTIPFIFSFVSFCFIIIIFYFLFFCFCVIAQAFFSSFFFLFVLFFRDRAVAARWCKNLSRGRQIYIYICILFLFELEIIKGAIYILILFEIEIMKGTASGKVFAPPACCSLKL